MGKVIQRSLSEHSLQQIQKTVEKLLEECGVTPKGKKILISLLTESELVMLGRRIQIARMLLSGKSRLEIQRTLHVGVLTIEAIARWLDRQLPGYRRDLYIVKKERKSKEYVPADLLSFRALRQRYPMEFLLINLLLGDPRK